MRWLLISIPVLVLFGRLYAASLDVLTRPKSYCGTKLTRIMAQFCLIYPSLPEHRQKRQIATECCHNKCSLDYLLDNYCGTVDMEALERFKLNSQDSEETSHAPQIRDRRRSGRFGKSGSTEDDESAHRSHRRRGKRNCTCKKHQRKRKSRRSQFRILSRRKTSLPEARIGYMDEYQEPFLVGNNGK